MTKKARIDCSVYTIRITFPLTSTDYSAAKEAIRTLAIPGAKVELLSSALQRVPASEFAEAPAPAKGDDIPEFLRKPK